MDITKLNRNWVEKLKDSVSSLMYMKIVSKIFPKDFYSDFHDSLVFDNE